MRDLIVLKGTKFLFDENLISYAELVQLLEDNNLNTQFIKKPLEENLKVHSLYIKSDFEVAYLVHSDSAESIYAAAGDFIKQYTETTLYEVIKLLGYCDIQNSTDMCDVSNKKQKKSKFITLIDKDLGYYTFRKKKIDMFVYRNSQLEILYLNAVYYFYMTEEKYNEIKTELMS